MSFTTRASLADTFGLELRFGKGPYDPVEGEGRLTLDLGLFPYPFTVAVWSSVLQEEHDRLTLLLAGPGDLGLFVSNGESGGMILMLIDRSKLPERGWNLFESNKCQDVIEAAALVIDARKGSFKRDKNMTWSPVGPEL